MKKGLMALFCASALMTLMPGCMKESKKGKKTTTTKKKTTKKSTPTRKAYAKRNAPTRQPAQIPATAPVKTAEYDDMDDTDTSSVY